MEFSLAGGLVAGLVATAVMSAMMKLSAKVGLTDMPPMELVTGSMMSGIPTVRRRSASPSTGS